jgi:hypothetical protein
VPDEWAAGARSPDAWLASWLSSEERGPRCCLPTRHTSPRRCYQRASTHKFTFAQVPVQGRQPGSDKPITIPDSVVAVQAFVMWEEAGRPQVGWCVCVCGWVLDAARGGGAVLGMVRELVVVWVA